MGPVLAPFRMDVGDIAAWVDSQGFRRRLGAPPRWLWFGLGAVNAALSLYALLVLGLVRAVWSWLPFALATLAFAAPAMNRAFCRIMLSRNPARDQDIRIEWEDSGLAVTYGAVREALPFAMVRRVDERPAHVLLWLDGRRAFIVPNRAFATSQDAARFAGAVRRAASGGPNAAP